MFGSLTSLTGGGAMGGPSSASTGDQNARGMASSYVGGNAGIGNSNNQTLVIVIGLVVAAVVIKKMT